MTLCAPDPLTLGARLTVMLLACILTACGVQPEVGRESQEMRKEPTKRESDVTTEADSFDVVAALPSAAHTAWVHNTLPEDVLDTGRRPTRLRVRARWSYVATLEDTTILHPMDVVATQQMLVLSDVGRQSLLGMDSHQGKILWRSGGRGSGPGESQSLMLRHARDTSVLVYDPQLRRIAHWTQHGTLLRVQSVANAGHLQGFCTLAADTTLVFTMPDRRQRFVGLGQLLPDRDSLVDRQPLELDWTMHPSGLDAQYALSTIANDECALAGAFDSRFWILRSSDSLRALPLVETVAPPQITETRSGPKSVTYGFAKGTVMGTQRVAASTTHVFVAFHGRTGSRGQLLDVYARQPWAYEGSLLAKGIIRGLTARDSTLAIVSEDSTGLHRIDVFTVSSR